MRLESDNRMRWDRYSRGHYEAWEIGLNDRRNQTGFWIRYAVHSPFDSQQTPSCSLTFFWFDGANPQNNLVATESFAAHQLRCRAAPFRLQIGPALLTNGAASGQLTVTPPDDPSTATIPVSWDLEFTPCSFFHDYLPHSLHRSRNVGTTMRSPHPLTAFTGRIRVGTREFILRDEPGCQLHRWGSEQLYRWAWAHCSSFREDPTASLEILSARIRRGPIVSPAVTSLSVYLGSEVYAFRDLWTVPLVRATWDLERYRFQATGPKIKILGQIRYRHVDLLESSCLDPNGKTARCHRTTVADAAVILFKRRTLLARFRRLCRLTTRHGAHLELGTHERADENPGA